MTDQLLAAGEVSDNAVREGREVQRTENGVRDELEYQRTERTGPDESQTVSPEIAGPVVAEILERVREEMRREQWPAATYRLQFHRNFTFQNAAETIEYLNSLGISHVYASPYLKARKESAHGYDIVDHNALNPEIGDEESFQRLVDELRRHGMGHILDVVPNHMGIATDENPWWQDVLENGPSSPYANFFDIDWSPLKPDLKTKVLLPVLSDQFGHVLEQGELQLGFTEGTLFLSYWDRRFPIAPGSYAYLLQHRLEELQNRLGADDVHFLEYQSILTAISHLPPFDITDAEKQIERHREKEVIKRRIARLCDEAPAVATFIEENVAIFNGHRGDPSSFDLLDELLQRQPYRLSYWRVAADEVNYRRFFDVNELAAVCMERPEVFEQAHALVFRLLDEKKIDGLRIDHADGLFDPTAYLWQLQQQRFAQRCRRVYQALANEGSARDLQWNDLEPLVAEHFARVRNENPSSDLVRSLYLVVEKILEGNERLPTDWPVHGTTGYDFLNQVNGLFVARENMRAMDGVYRKFTGSRVSFHELVYDAKKLIMKFSMSSELNALGHQLDRISERHRVCRDFTLNGLTYALREVVASFPIYRTYATPEGVLDRDRQYIEQAVAGAKRRNPSVTPAVFDFIRDVLLLGNSTRLTEEERAEAFRFLGRFQQFTGPMMAKAVEDTSFYNYNRLVSLNEVGGDPAKFGHTVGEFHQANFERQNAYPYGMVASSTHDTKRGEDVRARINVLSEIPAAWRKKVLAWTRWNKRKKVRVESELAPSRNDEYLLYQTLLGTWPFESPRGQALDGYVQRIQDYMIKAIREAKVHTSWIAPHEGYEQATRDFVSAILTDEPLSAFRQDFEPFAARVMQLGVWNSLAQTVLKLTCPGVPDVYQGSELWDLCLVDPDNRRPVDFAQRKALLAGMAAQEPTPERLAELVTSDPIGSSKLFVTHRCLTFRRRHQQLLTLGQYIPLEVEGDRADHVCAFARRHGELVAISVVPRLVATLLGERTGPPLGAEVWGNTALRIPPELVRDFRDLFVGKSHARRDTLPLAEILEAFPVAVLTSDAGHN